MIYRQVGKIADKSCWDISLKPVNVNQSYDGAMGKAVCCAEGWLTDGMDMMV